MTFSGACGFSVTLLTRCAAWLAQPLGFVAALAGLAGCYFQRERIWNIFQNILGQGAAQQSGATGHTLDGHKLLVDRVEKPGDPTKHYVSVSLAPAAAQASKKVGAAAHLILVIDVSGSMDGTRIATVRQSIKNLDVDENKNLLLTVITYHDKATTWIRNANVAIVAANIDDYTKIGGCTSFVPALDALNGEIRASNDGLPTAAIFLTDGQESTSDELKKKGVGDTHKLWREKNITPIMVGIGYDDVRTLDLIKGDLPGGQYFHISNEQKPEELTFSQIVNQVTKKTQQVILQNGNLQITPSCKGLGGGDFDSRVGPVSPADHYLVEIPASEKNVQITLTGTSLSAKQVVTLQSLANQLSKNDSIVWLALMTEAQNIQVEAVRAYAQDKNKASEHIGKMRTILSNIRQFRGADKPDQLADIETRLQGYIGKMEKREDLVNDDLFAAFSTAGAFSRVGSSSSSSSGSSAAIVMAPKGFSRAAQRLIPPINQAFYDAQMLSIPKANVDDKGRIVVNARDLFIDGDNGHVRVTLPMGYHCLGEIESGQIFSFSLTGETDHDQITGSFGPNTNIAKFEQENKVKFILPCERDAKVNVGPEVKKGWGIQEDADAYFQWIGPSAGTYRPEPGSAYYYDQRTPAAEAAYKKKALLDKMQESLQGKSGGVKLSSLEYFALTVGFFAYHEGDYYVVERNGKVNYRWDRTSGQYRQWDANNEQFVQGGKTFKANSIEASQLTRTLAQVRVLDPTSTFGGQFFPFDDLVQIPNLDQKKRRDLNITLSLQDEMEKWHKGKDDPLFGVTVDAFKPLGITHARWLNPTDKHYGKLIEEVKRTLYHTAKTEEQRKKYAPGTSWGQFGVYVYYCENKPETCYVIAMVEPDQAIASLKGKYQIMVEGAGKTQKIELEQSTCVVCEKNAPTMKLSCGETPYCSDCYEAVFVPADLLKIKCTNPTEACNGVTTITNDHRTRALLAQGDDKYISCWDCRYPNEVPLHTCGSCHQPIDIAKTEVKPLAAAKMEELLQGIPQFTFHLAKIDMSYDMDDFIVQFLKNKTYCSKAYPVPAKVKSKLNLPDNVATWAFISPVIGVDLATSLGVSDLFRLGLGHLKDKGHQKEHDLIEALYKTGGNVFFDEDGNVVSAYAYFMEGQDDTVSLDFKTSAHPNGDEITAFVADYESGKKTHITVKSFHTLAKWFNFNGNGFTYMLPGKTLDTSGYFVANLSDDNVGDV